MSAKKSRYKRYLCLYETANRYYGEPRALVTDKCTATIAAVNKLKNEGFLRTLDYRLSKYLNKQ
ncbi:hypothetical protein CMALT394_60002 [Carnobacterium maltaromaticum]|nr:hypothetical protein CMALT394_60002 [Carnobacterium maltaromaticum]